MVNFNDNDSTNKIYYEFFNKYLNSSVKNQVHRQIYLALNLSVYFSRNYSIDMVICILYKYLQFGFIKREYHHCQCNWYCHIRFLILSNYITGSLCLMAKHIVFYCAIKPHFFTKIELIQSSDKKLSDQLSSFNSKYVKNWNLFDMIAA